MKFKRILRTGFFNFWRNGTVSLASVLVMIVTLSVIALVSISGALLDTTLRTLSSKIDISVTFVNTATEEEVLSMKRTLEALPEVTLVTYLNKEEALTQFKERNINKPAILDALDELGENPLGPTLSIQARDPSQYASVAEFLKAKNTVLEGDSSSIIFNINYEENKVAIDRLTKLIHSADKIGLALTLFLCIISVLIAFNTIRLTIYIAKDEISVMRLVGASTAYIQGPFVVVGIIYGLVAGFLTLLLFLPATYYVGHNTTTYLGGFNLFAYYLRHILQMFVLILGSGVLIGALSSVLAIRKYLKV